MMVFLPKKTNWQFILFKAKTYKYILLMVATLSIESSAIAEQKALNKINALSPNEITFGLNKGASFVNNGEGKVSNWTSSEHKTYMNELGIKYASLHYNINLNSNRKDPLDWIYKNYINRGIGTTVILLIKINNEDPTDVKEIAKSEGLHSLILDGYYDQRLINIGKKIKKNKKKIRLSLLHEGNGGWYEWGMCAKGNTQDSLIKALKHSIDRINSTGASEYIEYDFNLNRTGCDGMMTKANQYLPQIERLVDTISVSTYNRCGTASRYTEEKQFTSEFLPPYSIITQYTKKPIYIAETATSGLCGDKITWYRSLFKSLKLFPQLIGVNFFFGDVPIGVASNDVPIMWGLNNAQKKEFRSIVAQHISNKKSKIIPSNKDSTFLGFSALPWSIWTEVAYEFTGPYTDSLNPITKKALGARDFTILTNANQRFYWGKKGSFQHGPGISLVSAFSSNKNRWWSNQIFPQFTYSMQFNPLTKYLGQWDASRLELYIGYRKYYAPAPSGSQGLESGIRALFIFGGNHMKN